MDILKCFEEYQIFVIPRNQNMATDTFAVAASTFKVPMHPQDKYKIKMKHRPAIPDNIKHWQVFQDDDHIEKFLTLSDGYKNMAIDEEREDDQDIDKNEEKPKANQEKSEKIGRLKTRLMGRDLLKSTQHFLWDLISIEVGKFWKDLRRLEVKKSYIYAALEKHKLATEQLAHLHKSPVEKAKSTINFLKFTSEEYLHNFKVDDRFQTIFLLQRVVEKDELIQKVHDKCKTLQEEVKAFYNSFKPLMDKGLPFFWDAENRLLRKDDYDNLIVAKRNDHTNFEDLEGNLRGEVLVTKLGDIFELLHMTKRVALPQAEVEEYINLEILSIQMRDTMFPMKNHFKELIKMAVRPLGLIPLTS